jgi:hypothetical protein
MSTTESEVHFSTNINLAWQKLDAYYNKTDATPIYRAAVVLYPRLKWRWFDRYWAEKPLWRRAAKEAVAALWEHYKQSPVDGDEHANSMSSPMAIHDDWSLPDNQNEGLDQFKAYIDEA